MNQVDCKIHSSERGTRLWLPFEVGGFQLKSFRDDEVSRSYPPAEISVTDPDTAVFEEFGDSAGGFFSHLVDDAAMPLITTLTT